MTYGLDDRPSLRGNLRLVPFLGDGLAAHVVPAYRGLIEEHGQSNVLVLKRFPTGVDEIANAVGESIGGIEQPRIRGLSAHARDTIAELPSPPRLLTPSEQGLLLGQYLAEHEWETPYLQRAARQESFESDVGRFVAEATWQGGEIETDEPALAELTAFNDGFHEWLGENGLLDPSAVLSNAAVALADADRRARVRRGVDAVLVLEFEEFTPIDRAYLARLTEGVDLVCIAERNSAIQRTWNEPGTIDDYATELTSVAEHETQQPSDRNGDVPLPAACASFLASDHSPTTAEGGSLTVIDEETFTAQVRTVAEEIERLHRVEGVPYSECAVVLRDSNAPVGDALRILRTAGIPTASATVGGLIHDPTARELYAVVCWCSDDEEREWSPTRARSVLAARSPTIGDELLERIRHAGDADGLEAALQTWLLESGLKQRIAELDSSVDAKTQFRHVSDVLQLARFVDESPLVDASWSVFARALEREFQHTTSDKIATELEVPEDGVLVDAVRVAKDLSREAVFLLDVVDEEFPADPQFNALFPTPHLEELPGYPAFTAPSPEDVHETFETAGSDGRRPLKAYYAELSRRMLAVGARTASDRLYFGTYTETEGGTGSRLQPSRFLTAVEEEFGELDRRESDEIHTHGEAVSFALTRTEDALEEIRLAGVTDDPIDIDEIEREFGVIQSLLANDPPDGLQRAIESRTDFAEGVVRRE
ncbi:hypothetical protein [Halomarina oriensis]|uniref:DNA helicase n=1 Tax=Halomarina oriensis TaxID=671145 RepID=A0A6B0GIT1_9EURY|nr:hypothetical protein [Halomarina oriensis]MWG34540.1 hypothetical protein [Halomarina oriensis]